MWLARYSPALFPLFLFRKIYHRGHGGRSLTAVKPWVTERCLRVTKPARGQALAARGQALAARGRALVPRVRALVSRVRALTTRRKALHARGRTSSPRTRALDARHRAFRTRRRTSADWRRASGVDGQADGAGGDAWARSHRVSTGSGSDRIRRSLRSRAGLPDPVATAPGTDTECQRDEDRSILL